MKKLVKLSKIWVLLLCLIIPITNCNVKPKKIERKVDDSVDLTEIRKRGKLVAATVYNSTNYFIYRGRPMGYQFELLRRFAEYLGVRLEIKVNNNLEKNFEALELGECDIIAANLSVTKGRSKRINFSLPISQTRQVLVQRKPHNWHKMRQNELNRQLIRNQLDLSEKIVYVQEKSAYSKRLHNLSEEIGDTIYVIEMPNYESEQLIKLVAKGEIDYTVCDENVALVNSTYYPNIDVSTAISFPQNLAWGLRKDSPDLTRVLNKWLKEFKTTRRYQAIYNRYFKNSKSANIVNSDYYALSSGRISPYDKYIKESSEKINWDWRLLASLIYQESRFQPKVKSWAGAYGLMQLMPQTAERFGVDTSSLPQEHIYAGAEFINWLDKRLINEVESDSERIKFILASYNVGLGHILDARRLAEKYGKDPNRWDENVDVFVLKKSEPEYYLDTIVKYGYCRGEEPYNYVKDIISRYQHYRNVIASN